MEWEKTFGGLNVEYGNDVQQTIDEGYIITGGTESFGAGGRDIWLIKTDSSGNKLWDITFGGSEEDTGNSVKQTLDGGYIIGGLTRSFGNGLCDAYLIKTNDLGDKIWDKTFGGSGRDACYAVQQTVDGGYILVGVTESFGVNGDVWLIKTDSLGNMIWDKTFGGSGADWGFSVQETIDGGFVIVGDTESYSAGDRDVWLIKTDSLGNMIWDKTFSISNYGHVGTSIIQTIDGGYIIVGHASFGGGDIDAYLIKTDSNGNKVWEKTYGGTSSDWGSSVKQTCDRGYIVVGATYSYASVDYYPNTYARAQLWGWACRFRAGFFEPKS